MVQSIWVKKGLPAGTINKEVTTEFAKILFGGVEKGFGKKISALDYDTPNFKMLSALQSNTWQFSAAKNYTQIRELGDALIGPDGKLRSYAAYKAEALKINDKHIKHYLKAEYNLAVASATMAAKWVDIQANKHLLPYLEFDAVIDNQTSELCSSLNGTILPVDHPFWDIYYPPNHFNCRSTVRQLANGVVTSEKNIPSADIPKMFQTNLGKNGLVYPKDSAYFIDCPKEVFNNVEKLINKPDLIIHDGAVIINSYVNQLAPDFKDVLAVAKDKGSVLNPFKILPNVNQEKNPELYKELFIGAKNNKCPDLFDIINKDYYEVKSPKNPLKIKNITSIIDEAALQADKIIIVLNETLDNDYMERVAKGRFNIHKKLIQIEFKQPKGNYEFFNREMYYPKKPKGTK